MNKQHPIDELFKQHLSNASVKPAPDMWNRIAQERKRRQRKKWWILGGTSSLVLIFVAGTFLWMVQPSDSTQNISNTEIASNVIAKEEIKSSNSPSIATQTQFENQSLDFSSLEESPSKVQQTTSATNLFSKSITEQGSNKNQSAHTNSNSNAF